MVCKFITIFELFILSVYVLSIEYCISSCKSESQNGHLYLATKTPYRHLANKDDSPVFFKGCTPEKIWMTVRHGTRNPSQKVIRKMREHLPSLRTLILKNAETNKTLLCKKEIVNLINWTTELEESEEKRLTHEGEDEMIELAERFQKRFPDILSENYTNSTFKFQHTATQRTAESARYFAVGLFGRKVSRYVWFPDAIYRDPILRFYKLCTRWRSEVKKNLSAVVERDLFAQGPEMMATLHDISQRLGFAKNLSFDEVHIMYVTCAFETAWHSAKRSPWCAAFSERNLQVLEYYEDLEYFWIDGYGYNLTYKQACPAIRDMIHFLRGHGKWQEHSDTRAVLYFTHSGTLLKLLSHLGLYRDPQPLRHDNFDELGQGRRWKVSLIDSFGTNLAFVLFRCRGLEPHILTLHQERPVRLPGCPPRGLCPLSAVLASFQASVDECDFDGMCSRDP